MGATGNEASCEELCQGLKTPDGSVREFLEPFLGHVMKARGKNTAHQCISVIPEGHSLPVLPDLINGISLPVVNLEPWNGKFLGSFFLFNFPCEG